MKYLIPIFTGIGDAIMLTPLLTAIKKNDPDAKIHIIGDNKYSSLTILRNNANLTFTEISHEDSLFSFLKVHQFDFHLCSINTTHLWIIRALIKANCANIYAHFYAENLNKFNFKSLLKFIYFKYWKVSWVPLMPSRHDTENNLDLLEFALKKPILRNFDTWISIDTHDDVLKKFDISENENFICIQPSAANGQPTPKRWAPENFVELCNQLMLTAPRLKIVLLGDKGDSENVVEKYSWPLNTINLCGKTTLSECVSILKKSKVLICHDSGLMHISSALNHPTVALVGPTDYVRTGPCGKKTTMLVSNNDANRIMYFKKTPENSLLLSNQYLALSNILIKDVYHATMDYFI